MTRHEILEFAAWIEAAGIILYGERIGVVRDEAPEFIGDSKLIVAADPHKRKPKKGTVVMVGLGTAVTESDLVGLQIGDKVVTNVYNNLELRIPNKDGKSVIVDIFHAADIYLGFRPDMEVEPA